jgi:hypothetical protein
MPPPHAPAAAGDRNGGFKLVLTFIAAMDFI